jgi:hypothetical protein
MQVGNAPHRKSRQIRHPRAFRPSYRDRKRSDCGRLIHDKQDPSVLFEPSNQRSQLRLIIGQRAVQKAFALAIQGHGMMRSFAYVDTDEDLNAVMLLDLTHA